MGRMGLRGLVCACALVGCAGRLVEDVGQTGASLSTPDFGLNASAPTNGFVGAPLTFFQGVYSNGTDVHHDVTMTSTIVGSFDKPLLDANGYDPSWACTEDDGTKGQVTITCHADDLQFKDYGIITVTPNVAGAITIDTHANEGGVEFDSFHGNVPISVATGSDLGINTFPGGIVPLGTVDVPFFANNAGPLPTTGVVMSFALTGPGKFVGASAFPSACTFADTTATCSIGDMPVYANVLADVTVQSTAAGTVIVTGSIAGNDSDPVPWNDEATAFFNFYQKTVADLSVSQTAAPSPAKFNKPMTYTLTVTNKGPDAASDALLYDYLPTNVAFGSLTTTQGSCSGGGYVQCDLGALAANASATIKVVVTPTEGGTIANSVNIYDPNYLDIDPDYSNNYSTITTTVQGPNDPVVVTSNEQKVAFDYAQWVDCAHDFVELAGTMHYSTHSSYNKNNGHVKYDAYNHMSDVKGVGVESHTTYTATGSYHYSSSFGTPVTSFDYEDIMHVVGKGAGMDVFLHVLNHVTYASDGTPKVSVSKYSYTCK